MGAFGNNFQVTEFGGDQYGGTTTFPGVPGGNTGIVPPPIIPPTTGGEMPVILPEVVVKDSFDWWFWILLFIGVGVVGKFCKLW